MVFGPGCSLIGQKNTKGFLPNQEPGFARSWNWSIKSSSPGALTGFLRTLVRRIFSRPVRFYPRPDYLPLGLRGWSHKRSERSEILQCVFFWDSQSYLFSVHFSGMRFNLRHLCSSLLSSVDSSLLFPSSVYDTKFLLAY